VSSSVHRRLSVVALALTLGASVTACGSSTDKSSTPGSGSGPSTLKTLQFVNPLPSEPVWKEISDCIGDQAEAKGLTYTASGPPASKPADSTVMIQQIQDATASGVDAIITFPASGAFGPVLQQAQKKGVVTATLYGDGTPESGATVNAGVDWTQIGEQYVDAIAAMPGDHIVGLVAEGPTGIGKSWTDGVQAAADNTSNVKIAGTVYIGADASKALPQVTNLLTAHSDIDLVASNTGLMTQGAVSAIKAKHLEDKVKLLVINNANGGPEAVREGTAIGVYLQDLCDLGKRTVDGVVDASEGKKVPLIAVNAVIANKDNLQEYLDKGWQ
jgi:ABC-type sugar transport system substrate-binding protein